MVSKRRYATHAHKPQRGYLLAVTYTAAAAAVSPSQKMDGRAVGNQQLKLPRLRYLPFRQTLEIVSFALTVLISD